ncbi:MAG: hypothetical protein DSM106950_45665 [Stigonema ocellatum SAG 48.90 = DSM 106950]|nr:hypothetical protein [Stigonema ocellatum SAG 48.90 = DSM 106950]
MGVLQYPPYQGFQRTHVTPNGTTFNITGGTQAGANLFHSFQEFSVPMGGNAFFNNAVNIQNIISILDGWVYV